MRNTRIFIDQPLSCGTNVIFDERAARHVNQVLRLKRGESVTLFNGQGGEFYANLTEVTRRSVKANVETHVNIERESPLKIHLGQGLAKGERMDIVIQKAVELGVSTITPVATERSVIKLTRERAQRRHTHWTSIAIHACQQCGRNRVPTIGEVVQLSSWVQENHAGLRLLSSPVATQSLNSLDAPGQCVTLLVGPEGGLTEQEQDFAARHDFVAVRLGGRILRTETASIAALVAIQLKWGDLS